MMRFRVAAALWAAVAVSSLATNAYAQTPKPGGHLNIMLREDLSQGFAVHETSTISTSYPSLPCFNNLVFFDQLKRTESLETLLPELAEKWSWQDNFRNLVFFLRKDWYTNIEAVEAADPHTVVFRLKRPQPSLLLMLASGYTPIYAAHVPPASYRTGCVGTGPFKLKEWRKGEFVEYVKNPDYFVKGRPYLDGLRYLIIGERGTATAALQAGRVDTAFPGQTPKPIAERLKKAVPQLVMTPVNTSVIDHLVVNTKKPPFDNAKVRLALSRAIDRRALIDAVYQGGAVLGASMASPPYGVWGLLDKDIRALPGNGKAADEKAGARTLLAEAGFGPNAPLRLEMLTRALPDFLDVASFVINELKHVGVEASLRQVESAQWHPLQTRGDFQIGI